MELEVDKLQLNWSLEKKKLVHQVLSGEGWPGVFLLFPDWQQQRSGLVVLHSLPSILFPLWLRQASQKASQIPTGDSSGIRGKERGTIPSGYQSTVFFFTLVSIWKTCLGFHSWGKWSPMLISLEMRERHFSYPPTCSRLQRTVQGNKEVNTLWSVFAKVLYALSRQHAIRPPLLQNYFMSYFLKIVMHLS